MKIKTSVILLPILFFVACCAETFKEPNLESDDLKIEYNDLMHCQLTSTSLDVDSFLKGFSASEYIIVGSDTIKDFKMISFEKNKSSNANSLTLIGEFQKDNLKLKKKLVVTIYEKYKRLISTKVKYTNLGEEEINISSWINNSFKIAMEDTSEEVWSYQSGSYANRPDWVLQVPYNFSQKNYMGMNASDYGGGTPVSDVWKKNIGVAVGHLENVPKLVSLPVSRNANEISINVNQEKELVLESGKSFETYETFVSLHNGDYFESLTSYSLLMQDKGLKFKKIDESAYEPIWCAWGYERGFKIKDILATLPKVKELGFKWAVLDDGWQTAEGDWYLDPQKFPNGDSDMIDFVAKIHEEGLKAKIWWVPLSVDPGTDLHKNRSDLLLINKEGKPQDITWWNSYYLCPAYEGTLEYTDENIKKFINEWGYDGLKIDGQHLNAAPPCYNRLHKHKYPEESVEAMPTFYNHIFETVMKYKQNAVVEICPCGDAYSYFMLPYINQPVSSDPTSSWQIRTKGKTIKALMGRSAPYYGDHVELSSTGKDFASTIGVGGIIGSKFTWPVGTHINTESGDVSLTPEREVEWKKWIEVYENNMLPKAEYLGELYDIGFDKPETHVVRKENSFYYAFYTDSFEGTLEIRGLEKEKTYTVIDYVNNLELPKIDGNNPILNAKFSNNLLIKVSESK